MKLFSHRHRGLSLVEVVVSTLLVGMLLLGALSTLGASVRTQWATNDLIEGQALANAMLAEIMSKPFDDPEDGAGGLGSDTAESASDRTSFDDIDDYNGWSPAYVQDRHGNVMSEYTGWSRSVVVEWAKRSDGDRKNNDSDGLKRILITVTSPDGDVTKRFGMRSIDGSLEQPPEVDKQIITQIEASLTLGSSTTAARTVTNLMNHVEDPYD